ncbi:MAG: type IIA DNA topoisomerase subunit B [Crocinitomicaceae bacterium]|jgi:topoisomerase IV subunit B|nr:type IIA DNA topoisomerase subunit B [Crocinitomicaceae bacterium]MDP4740259.1 type IIA DNA topoisomerase subunit B [Crocinitomicaceae bacterium]MDP4799077.1 type IIA DNA topoisomerase subunit B [Crocinitomicaceae bacterium]MDP4806681.1 type IIA DNA topoisomerase subunit B [Crocinitomicaceae bacterium]MDP4869088.1 type IIA DNA topoisomerase subunit B [Crocinitomicaceae bacterium]
MAENQYTEDNIRSLDWKEHIRLRPGMYIGKLGDGAAADDGIYILVKEVVDNCIDEFVMGNGKRIDIKVKDGKVSVRDYGRGIPLGKVVEVVSKMNTGGKYDSKAFKKSVGLNGVGTKAVNALSSYFMLYAVRDGQKKTAIFERGELVSETAIEATEEGNGTYVEFTPDDTIFKKYAFKTAYLDKMMWNYCYLNRGLSIYYNGEKFNSKDGLKDLLENNMDGDPLYPIMHLEDDDIEVAFTHGRTYGEDYYSFVNGQHTTQGGTHQSAFRESVAKVIRDFYNKNYEASDIRQSIVAAIAVKVVEPVFESQTKTKLGSQEIEPGGKSMRAFINDFLKDKLDNYLHRNPDVAEIIEKKIKQSERERKDLAGIRKLARDRSKKASLHNKKLRDCRTHLTDLKDQRREDTTLFITEGDSASGSITKSRDVNTQAVFSLRGKPLNCYGLTKKVVYENEEFNLIQAALDIEEDMDNLRYNRIVIATDADVDGMHIRMLLLTFFLQFFPDLVKRNHVYVLQTPLFRVRNKKKTIYCYSEDERRAAMAELGKNPEITRFKGLGEISPDEFIHFIGEDIRLEPVILTKDASIDSILSYFMGKNTPERQDFIIDNLRVEKDLPETPAADTTEEATTTELAS